MKEQISVEQMPTTEEIEANGGMQVPNSFVKETVNPALKERHIKEIEEKEQVKSLKERILSIFTKTETEKRTAVLAKLQKHDIYKRNYQVYQEFLSEDIQKAEKFLDFLQKSGDLDIKYYQYNGKDFTKAGVAAHAQGEFAKG